jgi:peptidoglycan/xylan/chitin deacetylase (PgdA/CDA1 family)
MFKKKKIIILIVLFFAFIVIIFPSKEGIPVLLFHHIWQYDRVTSKNFEEILIWLKKEGYQSIFISDLLKYNSKEIKHYPKLIVLTFDDGYVDNFINAFPLLKKYGFKGTIFVITSKISDKSSNAYLSWEQIKEMISSGYIEIQSHSHTHRYCYISNKIVTFNSPFFWDIEYSPDGDRRLGIPIYERKSSLIVDNCYDDDKALRDYLADYVMKQGGKLFFSQNLTRWQNILSNVAKEYLVKYRKNGDCEYHRTWQQRVIDELIRSKRLIENKIGKSCISIAWPWGEYNERLIEIAGNVGYKICVNSDRGMNYHGEIDLRRVERIEVQEYGIEKLILGRLSITNSIKIRLFIYEHYILAHIYKLLDKIVDYMK